MQLKNHISVRTVSDSGSKEIWFLDFVVHNAQKICEIFYLKTLAVVHIIQIRVRENLFSFGRICRKSQQIVT